MTESRPIAAADITETLGYPPYDGAANPAGFLTSTALASLATQAQLSAAIAAALDSALTTAGAGALQRGQNLADLGSAGAARGNLGLAAVASSGRYADLSGLPAIPADTAQLGNGAGFVTAADAAASAEAAAAGAVARAIPATGALLAGSGAAGAAAPVSLGPGLALADGALSPVVGSAAGSLAAGDDARIVAAARAADLAPVAFSGRYADLLGVPSGGGGGYALPEATPDTLGGVRPGTGLQTAAGVLSITFGAAPGTAAAGDDDRIVAAAQRAANLADLADPVAARANLGLSGAATALVGAGAGTLAAGDDPRIVAAQTSQQVGDAIAQGLAGYATTSSVTAQINDEVSGRIADLVGAAPSTLDTLAELAAQLQSDENEAATLAGLVATKQDAGQVAAAIAAGTAAGISGTLDLAHGGTGATTAADARAGLGLGTAATRDVGTAAGTAAAGDDARFGQALQKAANLGDLASAAAARSNLGLGAGATAAVGAAAGTLAAGDDARIAGAAQKAANLSDLANKATARTNLGLGAAATAAVGATAGTVAAGNDARIAGAAQKAANLSDLADPVAARVALGGVALESWVSATYAAKLAPAFTGPVTVTDPSASSQGQLTVTGSASSQGANLRLVGNGADAPSKTMRANGGRMEWVNHAYTAVIMWLDDAGHVFCNGLTTGWVATSYLNVAGPLNGPSHWGASAGLWQGWNLVGGQGKSDLVNSRGGGGGGFNFWNVATDPNASPTLLLDIDGGGLLTTPDGPLASRAWAALAAGLSGRTVGDQATIAMTPTDCVLRIRNTNPLATAVSLPANPVLYLPISIKDGGNNAGQGPITMTDPNGHTVDGKASLVIATNGGAETLRWMGDEWSAF